MQTQHACKWRRQKKNQSRFRRCKKHVCFFNFISRAQRIKFFCRVNSILIAQNPLPPPLSSCLSGAGLKGRLAIKFPGWDCKNAPPLLLLACQKKNLREQLEIIWRVSNCGHVLQFHPLFRCTYTNWCRTVQLLCTILYTSIVDPDPGSFCLLDPDILLLF